MFIFNTDKDGGQISSISALLNRYSVAPEGLRVLVYGTLRRGGGAYRKLEGLEYENTVSLDGSCMYSAGAFPFVVPSERIDSRRDLYEASSPLAEAFTIPDKEQFFDKTLKILDTYEGVPHLYHRSYYYYTVEGEPRLGIVYTWADNVSDNSPLVVGGDWLKFIDPEATTDDPINTGPRRETRANTLRWYINDRALGFEPVEGNTIPDATLNGE